MRYLIANWKAELSPSEVKLWVSEFTSLYQEKTDVRQAIESKKISIIICPSYPHIMNVKTELEHKGIEIGSQDISAHQKGKFTGEVTAKQLQSLVSWSIIGHSERRSNEHENEDQIAAKLTQCRENHINTILCVRGNLDMIHSTATMIAYEPTGAIGSGKNEDPQQVAIMKKKCNLKPDVPFLYGGSVDEQNIPAYLETNEIDGFLVGTASLDPQQFMKLAQVMI